MELSEMLLLVRRRWLVLVLAVAVGFVAGFLTAPGTADRPAEFSATTTMFTNPRSTERLNLQQAALLATTGEVPVTAADRLGLSGKGVVKRSVKSTASTETASITIEASRPSPTAAEELSTAVAEELIAFIAAGDRDAYDQQIEDLTASIAEYRAQVNALIATGQAGTAASDQQADLQAAQGQLASALASLQQLQTQGPPPEPLLIVERGDARQVAREGVQAPDSKPLRGLLLSGFGLLVGLGAVFTLDRLDTRIRTKGVAEAAFGVRVLAEIPPTTGRAQTPR